MSAATAESQGRLPTGCLLASSSPRSKQLMMSPQSPLPPGPSPSSSRGLSNSATKRQATLLGESRERYERRVRSLQSPQLASTNTMCEEAYQLVQFCNHCTFGLDGVPGNSKNPKELVSTVPVPVDQTPPTGHGHLLPPRHQSTPASCEKFNSRNKTVSRTSIFGQSSLCERQDETEYKNLHYPFITPPNGERDIPLSQLNSGWYQLQPGPPKELRITRCRTPKRQSEISKSCRDLDEAVRPVMYDWNGWWEAERVLCMMNEESYLNYVECQSKEDTRKTPRKNSSKLTKKSTTTTTSFGKEDPSFLTPTNKTGNKTGTPTSRTPRSTKFEIKLSYGQSLVRKLRVQRHRDAAPSAKHSGGKVSCSGQCSDPSDPSTRRKVVEACRSLKLIVSIPFRKLVTERQMKKYCGETGGKHRIPTL